MDHSPTIEVAMQMVVRFMAILTHTCTVYKQPEKIEKFGEATIGWTVDGRAGWKAQQFADRYSFGDPVAGNFYLARWDEYVPVLDRELNTPF